MSRSKCAWMERHKPVSVVACGVGDRARFEHQTRLERGSHIGAVSSTKRLVRLVAASVLVMGAAPGSALAAGSASGSHAKPLTDQSKQQSADAPRARTVRLALGSGYSSRQGAARVRALQRRLARAGYAPGPIDGRYGPRTEQAVSHFQTVRGLEVDGIAGPLTLAALRKPSVVLYPGAGYAGQGSGRVRVLQRRLARAGYAPGPDRWSLRPSHRAGGQSLPGRTRLAGRRDRRPADTWPPGQPAEPGRRPLWFGGLASPGKSSAAPGALAAAYRSSAALSGAKEGRAGAPFDGRTIDGRTGAADRARRGPRALGDTARSPAPRPALCERRCGRRRCFASRSL